MQFNDSLQVDNVSLYMSTMIGIGTLLEARCILYITMYVAITVCSGYCNMTIYLL